MSHARAPRRMRALLVLVALVAPLLGTPSAVAATDEASLERMAEQLFFEAHLDVRQDPAGHGVTDHPAAEAIEGHTDILDVSRAWSSQMARNGKMSHNPSFGDQLCCWRRVGENVARFSSDIRTEDDVRRAVEILMDAWVRSDGHRANIMDARWDQFAVGVDLHDGTMWATTNFRTLASGANPPGESYGAAASQDDGFQAQKAEARPAPEARDTSALCDGVQHEGYDDTHGNAHEASIRCASGHGLAQGRGNGEYDPAGQVSRGQVVVMLHRALTQAGHTLGDDGVDHFDDDNGTFLEQAANELAAAGYLVVGSRTLAPSDIASRAFIADTTGRAVVELTGTTASTDWFADDDGLPQEERINVLAEAGVVTGNGQGAFGPKAGLSRAQVATVLIRAFDALAA